MRDYRPTLLGHSLGIFSASSTTCTAKIYSLSGSVNSRCGAEVTESTKSLMDTRISLTSLLKPNCTMKTVRKISSSNRGDLYYAGGYVSSPHLPLSHIRHLPAFISLKYTTLVKRLSDVGRTVKGRLGGQWPTSHQFVSTLSRPLQ